MADAAQGPRASLARGLRRRASYILPAPPLPARMALPLQAWAGTYPGCRRALAVAVVGGAVAVAVASASQLLVVRRRVLRGRRLRLALMAEVAQLRLLAVGRLGSARRWRILGRAKAAAPTATTAPMPLQLQAWALGWRGSQSPTGSPR